MKKEEEARLHLSCSSQKPTSIFEIFLSLVTGFDVSNESSAQQVSLDEISLSMSEPPTSIDRLGVCTVGSHVEMSSENSFSFEADNRNEPVFLRNMTTVNDFIGGIQTSDSDESQEEQSDEELQFESMTSRFKRSNTAYTPGFEGGARDSLHSCGRKTVTRSRFLRNVVNGLTPQQIHDLGEDAVAESVMPILMVCLGILVVYLVFFITGYQDCIKVKYLSIDRTDQCESVRIALSSEHFIDDKGLWDTSENWSFSTTMLSVLFVGFRSTTAQWKDVLALILYEELSDMNDAFETNIIIHNLVTMAVSDKKIQADQDLNSNSSLKVRLQADPKSLMDAAFKDAFGIRVGLSSVDDDYDYIVSQMTFEDKDQIFELSLERSAWEEDFNIVFPVYEFDIFPTNGSTDVLGLRINKYSVWVAAAVNMGLLSLQELVKVSSNAAGGVNEYMLYKFYEDMSPIECSSRGNGVSKQYCNLAIDTSEDYSTAGGDPGVRLFPIMQHYAESCNSCDDYDGSCDELDIEFYFYYNTANPTDFSYFDYDKTVYYYPVDESAALDGVFYLNTYSGIDYMNAFFYELPSVHCARPIQLVEQPSQQGCGIQTSRKEDSFCEDTPLAIEEKFYKCRFSVATCLSTAVAEAGGWASLFHTCAMALLVAVVLRIAGKQPSYHDTDNESYKETTTIGDDDRLPVMTSDQQQLIAELVKKEVGLQLNKIKIFQLLLLLQWGCWY